LNNPTLLEFVPKFLSKIDKLIKLCREDPEPATKEHGTTEKAPHGQQDGGSDGVYHNSRHTSEEHENVSGHHTRLSAV